MSTNVPVTIWNPPDGQSEMGSGGNATLTTLLGATFVTLSGKTLITLLSTITPTPVTLWAEDDSK